jgi:hypothetical protein
VSRIESKPTAIEKNFEPRAEIHWRRVWRHSDISQVARAVPGRDVHAATKCDGEMRKVATHSDPLTVCIRSRAISPCVGISEFDVVMDKV